jgi:hypothetical protein
MPPRIRSRPMLLLARELWLWKTADVRLGLSERGVSFPVPAPDTVLISECSFHRRSNGCNKSVSVIPLFIRDNGPWRRPSRWSWRNSRKTRRRYSGVQRFRTTAVLRPIRGWTSEVSSSEGAGCPVRVGDGQRLMRNRYAPFAGTA